MDTEKMNSELEIKDKTKPIDSIKVALFKKHTRKTSPHKHKNYFEIVYLSKGKETHVIDKQLFEIIPPVVFIVRKDIGITPNTFHSTTN